MDNELRRIENRWAPNDGFPIGHPIIEEELESDVRFLINWIKKLKEQNKQLKTNMYAYKSQVDSMKGRF